MSEFRTAWKGVDLFDSIEEEGMTLTARACCRIAGEVVSALRGTLTSYVPEPYQEDGWATFYFTHLGQRIRCVVSMQGDNDYSITVSTTQSLMRTVFGCRAPAVKLETRSLDTPLDQLSRT